MTAYRNSQQTFESDFETRRKHYKNVNSVTCDSAYYNIIQYNTANITQPHISLPVPYK